MVEKINQLYDIGKITLDQKNMLLQAMQEQNSDQHSEVHVATILGSIEKPIQIKLISEDLRISGEKTLEQINILKGIEAVDVNNAENAVIISTKKEGSESKFFGFGSTSQGSVVIQAPYKSPITAKTVSSDVTINDFQSDILIKSVSGDIDAKNILGDLSAITVSGDINLDHIKHCSELVSKSGDIALNDCHVTGQLKSYSGDISFKNSTIDTAEIAVFSGDISLQPVDIDGDLYIKSFSGDIKLLIPASVRDKIKHIQFSVSSGDIIFEDQEEKVQLKDKEVLFDKGTVKIHLKSTSGTIKVILKKE